MNSTIIIIGVVILIIIALVLYYILRDDDEDDEDDGGQNNGITGDIEDILDTAIGGGVVESFQNVYDENDEEFYLRGFGRSKKLSTANTVKYIQKNFN